ncbi:hypothetical protein CBI38_24975 [Rhodococcus oxybenzonivorans]|uniref:Uncharacterized protein n=1 Tax=Rhodococcus oxybenzonivorans TaxID=1990687 RepID=A0A2S2C0A6_9NOCA|nr:hypothetical protein CBI38_24975 [Rhodococcus oxybenzonivorans]
MSSQAERGELEVWYSHIDVAAQVRELRDVLDFSTHKRVRKAIEKSRGRDSAQADEVDDRGGGAAADSDHTAADCGAGRWELAISPRTHYAAADNYGTGTS